jgi:hypothetical protein
MTMIPLALLSVASAAPLHGEIALEGGWLGAADPAYRLIGNGYTLGSGGLRLGWRVHDNVVLLLGWQHHDGGVAVYAPSVGATAYDEEYTGAFDSTFAADELTLGSKADVKVFKWLRPYVAAQLVGMRGAVRLDDDDVDDENLTQKYQAGVTGGLMGTAGLAFPIHVHEQIGLAPYVELGYGWLAPLVLGDLGSVQFQGFTGRAGLAVTF